MKYIKTYIVYLDESEDDWYDLYYVGSSEKRSKNTFKKEVPTFLRFVPEDTAKLKLVQVDLTCRELNLLKNTLYSGEFCASVGVMLNDLQSDDTHEDIWCEPGYEGFIEYICELYDCDTDSAIEILDNDLLLQNQLIQNYMEFSY